MLSSTVSNANGGGGDERDSGRSSSTQRYLIKHLDTFLTKCRRDVDGCYVCKVCREVRETMADMLGHFLAHTEEKPHVCSDCLIGFSTDSDLKLHTIVMHEQRQLKLMLRKITVENRHSLPVTDFDQPSPVHGAGDLSSEKPSDTVESRIGECGEHNENRLSLPSDGQHSAESFQENVAHDFSSERPENSVNSSRNIEENSQHFDESAAVEIVGGCSLSSTDSSNNAIAKKEEILQLKEGRVILHRCDNGKTNAETSSNSDRSVVHIPEDSSDRAYDSFSQARDSPSGPYAEHGSTKSLKEFPARMQSAVGWDDLSHKYVRRGDGSFSCTECYFRSRYFGNFKRHYEFIHAGMKPFKCKVKDCSYATTKSRALKRHAAIHSRNKAAAKRRENRQFLHMHPARVSKSQHSTTSEKYPDDKEHLQQHTTSTYDGENRFKCSDCSYSSSFSFLLRHHASAKHGEKRFKCSECPFSSAYAMKFRKHYAYIHAGKKPFKCQEVDCSYATTKRRALERHAAIHTDSKAPAENGEHHQSQHMPSAQFSEIQRSISSENFHCDKCSFSTPRKDRLKRHALTHTRPFKCSKCEYSSGRKELIQRHIASKHGGEKRFRCSDCSYSTCVPHHFVLHKQKHSDFRPFKCSECTFSTTYKDNLRRHYSVHTGKKPFSCQEEGCSYSTHVRIALQKHSAVHKVTKEFNRSA